MLRKRIKPNVALVVGLFALAAANIAHWFLARHTHVSEDIVDLTYGFTMGLAIATLFLAIVAARRNRD
jgi:uncharacterized membrane protein YphA (DoxX/SURF4 family)